MTSSEGSQIERAKKLVESPSKLTKKKANDPKRFIEQGHCTSDGEVADKVITALNQTQIDAESKYDGFMLSAPIWSILFLISSESIRNAGK